MTFQPAYESTQQQQPALAKALSMLVRTDGVAVVTYDVPGEPVNTLKATFNRRILGVARRNRA